MLTALVIDTQDDDDDEPKEIDEAEDQSIGAKAATTGGPANDDDDEVWESDPEDDNEEEEETEEEPSPGNLDNTKDLDDLVVGVKEKSNPVFFKIIMMYLASFSLFCSVPTNWPKVATSPYTPKMFQWIASWRSVDFSTKVFCNSVPREVQDIIASTDTLKVKLRKLKKLKKLHVSRKHNRRGVYLNVMELLDRVAAYVGSSMRAIWERIDEHLKPSRRTKPKDRNLPAHYQAFKDGFTPHFVALAQLPPPFDTVFWAILVETVLMIELGAYCTSLTRIENKYDMYRWRKWARQLRVQAKHIRNNTKPSAADDIMDSALDDGVLPLNHALPTKQGVKVVRPTHCGICHSKFTRPVYWDNLTKAFSVGANLSICDRCYTYQRKNKTRPPAAHARLAGTGLLTIPLNGKVQCASCDTDLDREKTKWFPDLGVGVALCPRCWNYLSTHNAMPPKASQVEGVVFPCSTCNSTMSFVPDKYVALLLPWSFDNKTGTLECLQCRARRELRSKHKSHRIMGKYIQESYSPAWMQQNANVPFDPMQWKRMPATPENMLFSFGPKPAREFLIQHCPKYYSPTFAEWAATFGVNYPADMHAKNYKVVNKANKLANKYIGKG